MNRLPGLPRSWPLRGLCAAVSALLLVLCLFPAPAVAGRAPEPRPERLWELYPLDRNRGEQRPEAPAPREQPQRPDAGTEGRTAAPAESDGGVSAVAIGALAAGGIGLLALMLVVVRRPGPRAALAGATSTFGRAAHGGWSEIGRAARSTRAIAAEAASAVGRAGRSSGGITSAIRIPRPRLRLADSARRGRGAVTVASSRVRTLFREERQKTDAPQPQQPLPETRATEAAVKPVEPVPTAEEREGGVRAAPAREQAAAPAAAAAEEALVRVAEQVVESIREAEETLAALRATKQARTAPRTAETAAAGAAAVASAARAERARAPEERRLETAGEERRLEVVAGQAAPTPAREQAEPEPELAPPDALDAERDAARRMRASPSAETCEIAWWRGYVKSEFYARAAEPDGSHYTVATSPGLRWRRRTPPPETDAAAAAHDALVRELLASGWEPYEHGPDWWAYRFWRPAPPGTPAHGE